MTRDHDGGKDVPAITIDADLSVGQSMAQIPLFREYLPTSPNGSFGATATFDGRPRLISYRTLENAPLVVAVALDEDALLAGASGDLEPVGRVGRVGDAASAQGVVHRHNGSPGQQRGGGAWGGHDLTGRRAAGGAAKQGKTR